MSSKVALVTGATGAIGEATATGLARLGVSVVLGSRDSHRGEDVRDRIVSSTGNPDIEVLAMDLSSPRSVRSAAGDFTARHSRLDILVQTAAIFTNTLMLTPEGWEVMFATNHLGPFLLSNLLLDHLKASKRSRVLVVTAPSTTAPDFDDLQGSTNFRALWAFGATKMCNLLFTYGLARRLEGSEVTANAFHPGLVRSGLMREAPAPLRWATNLVSRPPTGAAASLVALASFPKYESVSGKFFKGEQEIESNAYSRDPSNQARLWDISARLVGLATSV